MCSQTAFILQYSCQLYPILVTFVIAIHSGTVIIIHSVIMENSDDVIVFSDEVCPTFENFALWPFSFLKNKIVTPTFHMWTEKQY